MPLSGENVFFLNGESENELHLVRISLIIWFQCLPFFHTEAQQKATWSQTTACCNIHISFSAKVSFLISQQK